MDIKNVQDQNRRKLKVTFFYLALVGCMLMLSSIFVHRMISEQVNGQRAGIARLIESLPFFSSPKVKGINAAILQSTYTSEYLQRISEDPQASENYLSLSYLWLDYLERANIEAAIIGDMQILNGLQDFNLLILPMTICLSEPQVREIKRFLSQGRGVILTHAAGNRDERGSLRQWSLTSDLTGSRGLHFFGPEAGSAQIPLRTMGITPVTAGMPPGRKISIHTYDSPAGIELREDRVKAAAFWENPRKGYAPAEHTPAVTPIAYGNYMGGRFVWFGFTMRSVADIEESWGRFNIIMDNTLKWTTRKALAAKGTWPGGENAAAVFAVRTEENFLEALNMIVYLKSLGLNPAAIIPASPTEINLPSIHRIASEAPIVPYLISGPEFEDQTQAEKERTLKGIKAGLEGELDTTVDGIAIKETDYDITLINAAFRLRMSYVWLQSEHAILPRMRTAGVPQPVFRRLNQPVFFYGSSRAAERQRDYGALRHTIFLRDMRNELEDIIRTNGMFALIVRPEEMRQDDLARIMPDFVEYMRKKNVFTASLPQMSTWWRNYENVQISAEEERPGRISLIISNTGNERIPEMKIYVYPSSIPQEIRIQSEKIGDPIPEYVIDRENKRFVLDITNMSRNESRTYFITF